MKSTDVVISFLSVYCEALVIRPKIKTGRTFLKERCFHLVPVFLTARFDNSNISAALCTSNDLTVVNSILNL